MNDGAYLAGPMRRKKDFNFPEFFNAESWLLANTDFFPIFNPARRDVEHTGFDFRDKTGHEDMADFGFDLEEAMQADLDFIASDKCTHIILMDGWSSSEGSIGEFELALKCGRGVVFLRKRKNGRFYLWPEPSDEDRYEFYGC